MLTQTLYPQTRVYPHDSVFIKDKEMSHYLENN